MSPPTPTPLEASAHAPSIQDTSSSPSPTTDLLEQAYAIERIINEALEGSILAVAIRPFLLAVRKYLA